MLQLLGVVAAERWRLGPDARFATQRLGVPHRWTYRGQVVPAAARVVVEVSVRSADDRARVLVADALLCVDGRRIYRAEDFALAVLAPA
jgi:hypothetical protein